MEVHTSRHYGNNMVDVVGPGQSVIYNYTEKLETEHLLNLRAGEVECKGWWINSGSWGADEHTLVLISIDFQPIVGHPVYWRCRDRIEVRCSDACSVADKEDCSIISKEDSTAWRKNIRKVIYEERKKSGTKNRALRDTRGCSGRGCGIEHTSDLETPRVFLTRNTCSIHERKSLRNTTNGGCRLPHELYTTSAAFSLLEQR